MADRDDEKKQLIADYHNAFCSEGGKRVLANLKSVAHYNGAYFPHAFVAPNVVGPTDIYEVCREEGKRAMIVHIEAKLRKEPPMKGIEA
jgi:hypothetical protein